MGRTLVRLVSRLSAGVSAHAVLYSTLLIGLVIVVAFAAGGAAIYDAVATFVQSKNSDAFIDILQDSIQVPVAGR